MKKDGRCNEKTGIRRLLLISGLWVLAIGILPRALLANSSALAGSLKDQHKVKIVKMKLHPHTSKSMGAHLEVQVVVESKSRTKEETEVDASDNSIVILRVKGPKNAPITLVEFSDFQCPFCARVSPMIRQLLRQYPNQIKVIFKHFPLSFHPDAPLAHEAALAVAEQGKFWEMHDLLFANQSKLSSKLFTSRISISPMCLTL